MPSGSGWGEEMSEWTVDLYLMVVVINRSYV
jgi:hypothetical protein